MDIQIIVASLFTFCLFLGAAAILFRRTKQENAIALLIWAWMGAGIVMGLLLSRLWEGTAIVYWASLYSLCSALFVFGVFSNMEASLTLRILTEIAKDRKGVTEPLLFREYNRTSIVKRRVMRLLHSGELKKRGHLYSLGKISYFRLREYFLDFFRLAFA